MDRRLRDRPMVMAFAGSLILLLVYLVILTVSESFDHAVEQLTEWWYWIAPLVAGFGVQVGLYSHIRGAFRTRMGATATGAMATAGGVSTTSMIACCVHHLTDVLPIIGLSAAAVFLTEYQPILMALGVLSNLVGITVMLTVMQKHNLVSEKGISKKIFRYDMKRVRNTTIASSIILLLGITVSSIAPFAETSQGGVAQAAGLQPIVDEQNGVSFQITPIDSGYGKPLAFEVRIDTHQGDLDFDLKEVSTLETSDGGRYDALSWEGSPPGGHHRSGILTFPSVGETWRLKLTIRDVYEVPERVFIWDIQSSGRTEDGSSTLTYNNYVLGGTLVTIFLAVVLMNFRPRTVSELAKYEKLLQDKYRKLRETNE